MRKICLVLSFLLFNFSCAVVHESGSYNRTEEVNGTVFVCRVFFDGADSIKEFVVDQVVVDQAVYEQKKNEACQQELDKLCQIIQNKYLPFEQTCAQLRSCVAIKLIKRLREDSLKIVHRLHEHALEQFFVFKSETIDSATFLQRIEQQLLPALAFCDDERAQNEDSTVLKRLALACVELYEHLVLFYQDSVKSALEQADDPKELQKLLELL